MSWEDELRNATPRGLEGVEDQVPAARWTDPGELGPEWQYNRRSLLLGYRSIGGEVKPIGFGDDRHVMLVAGSRAGKGVSFIIPNLLLYEGSVLAIDPKGELASLTARRRAAMGQRVVVLDPFGASGDETLPFRGSFNPLDEIDPASLTAIDDAALLAEALLPQGSGSRDDHWILAGRELVKGLILFALLQEPEWRHLGLVRHFFRNPKGPRDALKQLVDAGDAFDGLVAGIGASFLAKEEREFTGIVSTAEVQLGFLDSLPLARTLKHSSFRLADLKQDEKCTVYLCLPASRMGTHSKWLRTIISLALKRSEEVRQIPTPPLLFLLEEFPVLGNMPQIEIAAGQIAGFGVKIWCVLQDLTQLQRHYGKSWETFIGNSGISIFFGNSDNATLQYVSQKLGVVGFDLRRPSSASHAARLAGAKLIDEQLQKHQLLEPHEAEIMFARETHRALVLHSGQSALIVRRANYRTDPALRDLV